MTVSLRSHGRFLMTFAVIGLLTVIASQSHAQVQAFVQIKGDPSLKDPHPITYLWDGEVEPVREPVQFYSYYYTGTVETDATVPVGEDIQRIAIPNNQWELNKSTVIALLTAFYEEVFNVTASVENQVVFDENFNYVEVEAEDTGAVNPAAAAEWMFYYDQFVLWQFYVRRVTLGDTEEAEASSPRSQLERQLQGEALSSEGYSTGDIVELLDAAEEIREGDEETQGPVEGPEVATEFDPEALYADPGRNHVFRDEFIEIATEREADAVEVYTDMLGRIEERADSMARLEEWLEDRKQQLMDFARAWGNVQEGGTIYFGDTLFLITKEPLEQVPYDTMNILVRDQVTPQDLLNKDGSLKKPEW